MYVFINLLKTIAAILIANSHFKGIYPSDIISFGGGFGLALFYMVSGFLLANIKENDKFLNWYLKRLSRLYVPWIIYSVVIYFAGALKINSISDFVHSFIFPGSWFIASMVVLYPIYYLFVKFIYNNDNKRIIYSLITLFIVYSMFFVFKINISTFSFQNIKIHNDFYIETPYLITHFCWFACMLLGLYLKKVKPNIKNYKLITIFLLSVLLFIFLKLFHNYNIFNEMQYFLVFTYIGFAYSLFNLLSKSESKIKTKGIIAVLSSFIGGHSLEIYYTQFYWIDKAQNMIFPVNFLFLIITIILSSVILHYVSNFVIGIVKKNKRLTHNF